MLANEVCIMGEKIIGSGNPIVDKVGQLNISGNMIPEAWYHTITTPKGTADILSILILAEIVYWYRPTEEHNDNKITYRKKFKADCLQKSYDQLMQKLNITHDQARNHVIALENLGVIKREFRTISSIAGPLPNVMYIWLDPDVLERLTYPDRDNSSTVSEPISDIFDRGVCKNTDTPIKKRTEGTNKKNIPISESDDTNTKTTNKITTKNTTSTVTVDNMPNSTVEECTVDAAKDLFSAYGFDVDTIISIIEASGNDIYKCKAAKELLDQQHNEIRNPAGWLIQAIKKEYQQQPIRSLEKNNFSFFNKRSYTKEDYAQLEADALSWQYTFKN